VKRNLHVGVDIFHGDHGVIDCAERIRALAKQYTIRECVFDPWRAGMIAVELEEHGIATTAFPQSDARMMPSSQRLYSAIVEQRLVLPDHEEMRQHAHAAIARHTRRGWRVDKTSKSDQIDAVIALCMALDAVETQPAPAELLCWL
jgi:phage terminase large subunit-like protein